MIEFIPFKPDHLVGLNLQPVQAYFQTSLLDPEYGKYLSVPGLSWSGEIDGAVVGSAGVIQRWPGRAKVWALFGQSIPLKAWVPITRFVEKVLSDAHGAGVRRLEAVVDPHHAAGVRWAERLGFICETPWGMDGYGADGKNYLLFARVRP